MCNILYVFILVYIYVCKTELERKKLHNVHNVMHRETNFNGTKMLLKTIIMQSKMKHEHVYIYVYSYIVVTATPKYFILFSVKNMTYSLPKLIEKQV